jgi:bacteriocin-like protein
MKTYNMNGQLKQNNATKHQQDSKIEITQRSGLTKLSDQELEQIVGGWPSSSGATIGSIISGIFSALGKLGL